MIIHQFLYTTTYLIVWLCSLHKLEIRENAFVFRFHKMIKAHWNDLTRKCLKYHIAEASTCVMKMSSMIVPIMFVCSFTRMTSAVWVQLYYYPLNTLMVSLSLTFKTFASSTRHLHFMWSVETNENYFLGFMKTTWTACQ